jgi:hypothetical protein
MTFLSFPFLVFACLGFPGHVMERKGMACKGKKRKEKERKGMKWHGKESQGMA